MSPCRCIGEDAGSVKEFAPTSSCSHCLCHTAAVVGEKKRWRKGPKKIAEKMELACCLSPSALEWTQVWGQFCACGWSRSREYWMSEGSLSPQAFHSPFLHNKEIWLVQIRAGEASQFSVAYLSLIHHPSLNISIPGVMQFPCLKPCGPLPEYLIPVHFACQLLDSHQKAWFYPPKLAKLKDFSGDSITSGEISIHT